MSTSGSASNREVSGAAGAGTTSRGPPKAPPQPPRALPGSLNYNMPGANSATWGPGNRPVGGGGTQSAPASLPGGIPPGSASGSVLNSPITPSSGGGGGGFWYGGSPPGSASGSINTHYLRFVIPHFLPSPLVGVVSGMEVPLAPASATPSYPQYPPGYAPPASSQSLGGFSQNSAAGYWYGGSPISASPSCPPGFGYPVAGGGGGGPPGSGGSSIRPPSVTSTVKAVVKEEETSILLIGAGLAGVVALVLMLQK